MNVSSKGFMLLEVVIGTMIASIISMILMNALGQMTAISQQVDEMYERTFRLMMLHHQFERDIIGMCVPAQGIIKEEKSTTAQNKTSPAETNSAKKTAQTVQQKPIKKIFFAAVSDTQQMQQLTFITNNPVPHYWQGTVGSAKPKIVRVVYYLQPDKEHPESLTLIRQESAELHAIAFGKDAPTAKAYAVADHIQSFSLTFSYETVQEGDKKTTTPKTQSAQVNRWNSDELLDTKKEEGIEKKYASLLPKSITISGALWNQTRTKTVPFSLTIPILANGFNAPIAHPSTKNTPAQQSEKEEQHMMPVTLEVDSMKEAIQALGGSTESAIILSDGLNHNFAVQAPVVEIPYDHIQIAFPR
jgi:type II secretory pathway pseudopilin PulG